MSRFFWTAMLVLALFGITFAALLADLPWWIAGAPLVFLPVVYLADKATRATGG